jgi:hypothetical protein
MRVDMGDADDAATIARLRIVLRSLGAEITASDWGMGVDVYQLRLGAESLTIDSDAWSVDIEWPEGAINPINAAVTQRERHDGGIDPGFVGSSSIFPPISLPTCI